MFSQGMFQIDPNATPEMVARKRKAIQDVMAGYGKAKYVGEGLGHLFGGIVNRQREKALDKFEAGKRSEAMGVFNSALGGLSGATQTTANPSQLAAIENPTTTGADRPNTYADAEDPLTKGPAQPQVMAAALDSAAKNMGMNERDQQAALQEYMANGGVNLDPATTAWCAAYVNAALGHAGIKGTGSNMARSFLDWGQDASKNPQRGDIAVYSRGDPNSIYGHVGFIDGVNEDGSFNILGGNQGDAVSSKRYDPGRLLGVRRAGEGGQPVQVAQNGFNPGFIEALQNPWLTPAQRQILLQQQQYQMQQNDPMRQLDLERARLEVEALRNPKPPKREMYEGADGYKYWTDDPTTRVNPNTVLKPTGPLVQIDGEEKAFSKGVGEDMAEFLKSFQGKSLSSADALGNLGVVERLIDRGMNSGWGAAAKTQGQKILAALGFNVDVEEIGDIEAFQSQVSQAILDAAGGSLGAQVSDSDRGIYERRAISLANTPGGNKKIIEIARRVHRRNIKVAEMAREYMKANDGILDYGFFDELGEYTANNSIFEGLFDDLDTASADRARLEELRLKRDGGPSDPNAYPTPLQAITDPEILADPEGWIARQSDEALLGITGGR